MTENVVRATTAQRSIYYDEVLAPDQVLHTMGDYLDITGRLDLGALFDATRQLIVEAEVLRVRLEERDGELVQVIEDGSAVSFDVVDLQFAGDGAAEAATARMLADQNRSFDVHTHPLLRGTIYVLGPQRHWCYLAMHHVLCDGYSRVPLYRRLGQLYRALTGAIDADAEPLPSLSALVDAETAYLDSPAQERDRRHWEGVARALPEPLTLSARPAQAAGRHLRCTAVIDATRAGGWKQAAADAGVTWAAFAVAAVSAFTAKSAGRASGVVTLPVTARATPVARRVPGMVANYLPIAADVRPWVTRRELLSATARSVLAALRHQSFRGEQVRRMAGLGIGDRRAFGPYVNVLPQTPVLDFGAAQARLVNLSTGIVDDLMVTVLDGPDGTVELHLNGNPARYAADELQTHLARLVGFLDDFAAAEGTRPLGSLTLRPAPKRRNGATRRRPVRRRRGTGPAAGPATPVGACGARPRGRLLVCRPAGPRRGARRPRR